MVQRSHPVLQHPYITVSITGTEDEQRPKLEVGKEEGGLLILFLIPIPVKLRKLSLLYKLGFQSETLRTG